MIIMSVFVNRVGELSALDKVFSSKRAELVLLYGRRRVGKSTLLIKSLSERKDALYLLGDSSKSVLDNLSRQVKDSFVRFSSWDDFFQFLLESKYKIIVIDEFQYLFKADKSWPSVFQRWWEKFKTTDKKIVLSGSLISTIYKITKGYGSALYGRQTKEMHVFPLEYFYLPQFFKGFSKEDCLKVFFMLGGVPRYFEEFDDSKSIEENILDNLLDKTSFLYNEPMNLLFEEFRDVSPYVSIMQSITFGSMTFTDISQRSGVSNNKLPKYLSVLERVGLVSKELIVSDKRIKSKNTRYVLKDNFFYFWFRFVFVKKQLLEQGLRKEVYSSIKADMNSFFGFSFEQVCKQFLVKNRFFSFTSLGRYWKGEEEIDVVALNEEKKEVLFCECKWQDNVNAEEITKDLAIKSRLFDWKQNSRKEEFAVFAKTFSKKITSFEGKKVTCFEIKDLFN